LSLYQPCRYAQRRATWHRTALEAMVPRDIQCASTDGRGPGINVWRRTM
jgi:hypothetical protein